jgi:hypothetical protein
MKGIVTAEQEHVVNILPPVDITGGKTSQAFSMAKHGHATIIVQIGVSAAAFTKIILQAGTATAAVGAVVAGAAALAFSLYSPGNSRRGSGRSERAYGSCWQPATLPRPTMACSTSLNSTLRSCQMDLHGSS